MQYLAKHFTPDDIREALADKVVILAPHVDDEMIGCYTLFEHVLRNPTYASNVTVVYMDADVGPDDDRWHEAKRVRELYRIQSKFLNGAYAETTILWDYFLKMLAEAKTIFLPSMFDSHPEHKALNRRIRGMRSSHHLVGGKKLWFYSVDMNIPGRPTPSFHEDDKYHVLKMLYPSQTRYFRSNSQASAFEDIRDGDLICVVERVLAKGLTMRASWVTNSLDMNPYLALPDPLSRMLEHARSIDEALCIVGSSEYANELFNIRFHSRNAAPMSPSIQIP